MALDQSGNIYASTSISSSAGQTIAQISPDGKVLNVASIPYKTYYAINSYMMITVDNKFLIQNNTGYQTYQTCQLSDWEGPILDPCVDGLLLASDDNGWIYTLDMTNSMLNAFSSITESSPEWTYTFPSYPSTPVFGAVWSDENLLLVARGSSLYAINLQTDQAGSLAWVFSFSNYAVGISVSPAGYILLYSNSYFTDAVGANGYSLGRSSQILGQVVVDSMGNFYGYYNGEIKAFDSLGNPLWESQLTYGSVDLSLGPDSTLYVMNQYSLFSFN